MSDALRPVFIIGSYRSGTSVFAWCLGQHPNLLNLPETNWIYRYALNLEQLYTLSTCNGKHSHLSQAGVSKSSFYEAMGEGVDHIVNKYSGALNGMEVGSEAPSGFRRRRSEFEPKSRWVDATPENTHYVYGLSRMFPDARFIHIVRDPDDVVKSLTKFSNVGARDYGVLEAYRTWLRLVHSAYDAEKALGSARVKRVLYEDLVSEPKRLLDDVLTFIGEDFSSQCVEPLEKRINSSGSEFSKTGLFSKFNPAVRTLMSEARGLYGTLESTLGASMEPDVEVLSSLEKKYYKASRR